MTNSNQAEKSRKDNLLESLNLVLTGILKFLGVDQKRIITKYNDEGRPIQFTPKIVFYGPNPLSDNVYRMTRDTLNRIYLSHSDMMDPPPTESSDPTAGLQNLAVYAQQQIDKIKNPKAPETPKQDIGGGDIDKFPDDLITLKVTVKDFVVSRATLKRKIKEGVIKSYRPKNAKQNSPHKVSRAIARDNFRRRNIVVEHKYPPKPNR